MSNHATNNSIEKSLDLTNPVNFVHQGTGQPVVLIHGLAASLLDWNDLIPCLVGSGFSTYALDLLGHGESIKPEHLRDFNINNVFEHFSDWLESLQIKEPLTLVGHSLGAYLAIQYAFRYPDRVRALVLVDPFISLNQLPFLLRINYRSPIISSTMIEHTPEWLFRKLIDLTSLSIRNGFVLSEEVRVQTAADYKRAHPGIFNIIHTIQDPSPQLSAISQPTLVIWGSRDQTLAPTSFTNLIKKVPHARGIPIVGAGHVPHQSHPAQFNQLVIEFLSSLSLNSLP